MLNILVRIGDYSYKISRGNKRHPSLGKASCKGLSIVQLIRKFPDDRAAEDWIAGIRRSGGPICPHCDSSNVQSGAMHPSMNYRYHACRKFFSVRNGTVMQNSNLGAQKWVIAIYMLTTGLKGKSSMKLHRDLDITQKSAWHLARRIRETWDRDDGVFGGPIEIDETYIGGKRRNMSNAKRKQLAGTGRGAFGKTAVIGIKDRSTNQVVTQPVKSVNKGTVNEMPGVTLDPDARAYTDDGAVYEDLAHRESVNHSVSEFVRGMAHTNGIESF